MGIKWVEISTIGNPERQEKKKNKEKRISKMKTESQRVTLGIAENLKDAEKG